MQWKYWLLGGFLGISTASYAQKQHEDDSESARAPKQETVAKPAKKNPSARGTPRYHDTYYAREAIAKNAAATADTTAAPAHNPDSLAADSLMRPNLPQDSLDSDTMMSACEKFYAAEEDMLLLVAHCEGIRPKAYWDPNGKKWTIGIGNTMRPDGTPVRNLDRIRSKEELLQYFKVHVEKFILPDMEKYLPLAEMNCCEIAAFGSFIYNCGSGVLRDKNNNPSELAKTFTRYKKEGREEDKNTVKKLINAKIYAKGRALPQLRYRRDLETRILFGDIVFDQTTEDSLSNALDFSAVSIGGIYTIGHKNGGLPKDSIELVNRINKAPGQNFQDTLRQAFPDPKVAIKRLQKRGGR